MAPYPVHYHVERPEHFTRIQLLIRFVAFIALGMLGLSFGSVFLFAFIALPVFAASRLASRGDSDSYVKEDGPKVVRVIHWFAALSAWCGLVAERLPGGKPGELVELRIDDDAAGEPHTSSAIGRVITGIPSALVLCVLGFIGSFVWLWAALSILVKNRVGPGAFNYLVGLQRWCIRLLAYQASLVDEYPPFSFSDSTPALPRAKAAM